MNTEDIKVEGFHRVLHGWDDDGFDSYIVVHNVNLGVAIGGCRALEYGSTEEALEDALRLAKGMTYKNALAGLDFGGGKSVINGKPTMKNLIKFSKLMDYINKDEEIYYTAGDMNTGPAELDIIKQHTKYINHCPEATDSGMATAFGVFQALKGALDVCQTPIEEESISIHGFGKVGRRLSEFMVKNGIKHTVADIHPISPEVLIPEVRGVMSPSISHRGVSVWMPCAAGGAITTQIVDDMERNAIICGGANNQLSDDTVERYMEDKGMIYVPDYLANAGGVIIISKRGNEFVDLEYDSPDVIEKLLMIRHVTKQIINEHVNTRTSTSVLANELAEQRFMK